LKQIKEKRNVYKRSTLPQTSSTNAEPVIHHGGIIHRSSKALKSAMLLEQNAQALSKFAHENNQFGNLQPLISQVKTHSSLHQEHYSSKNSKTMRKTGYFAANQSQTDIKPMKKEWRSRSRAKDDMVVLKPK